MIIEFGYGTDVRVIGEKNGWKQKLLSAPELADLKKDYDDWLSEWGGDTGDASPEDLADEYLSMYEGDAGCGEYGALALLIDRREFGGRTVFRFCDWYLYVPAVVPENDGEKEYLPTQERIRSILSEYLASVTDGCCVISRVAITDD